jgi:predicted short-subunit dehydrogenase-like oxidoreductase (DUF2520 family)
MARAGDRKSFGAVDLRWYPAPVTRAGSQKPTIAVVGAGSLGSALAVTLRAAGYKVSQIIARERRLSRRRAQALARRVGGRATGIGSFDHDVDLVWLCVPDREISDCARLLASRGQWTGKIALHSSGVLTSDELTVLRRRGAAVASLHPMMTFVHGEPPALTGVPFAVEGDTLAVTTARRIAKDLGGKACSIRKACKAAYHAWGSFASPLLISTLVTAERVAGEAGIRPSAARKRMLPILRQTVANYARYGPAGAFSGPIIRGDVATLVKHLKVVRALPDAKGVYLALARSAVKNLPAKNRKQLLRILA